MLRTCLILVSLILINVWIQSQHLVDAVTLRPAEYIAPANPCRNQDIFCSVKCAVLQLKGDFHCDFCACADRNNYVKWETEPTPDPTASSYSSTTLPPDTFRVNGITYHKVGDPCVLTRDRVCPIKCQEIPSTTPDGANCTMCDCQDASFILTG